MDGIINMFRSDKIRTLATRERYWHKAFFYAMLLSGIIFSVFMMYDNGYFLYYGDFNVQQVPFYQMIHDSLRSGNWKWSHTTDLGANIIGSYSFYMITSPFFWLTMPFPSEAVPYMMGPLLILKFSFASLTAYIYLRRYVLDKNNAVIGGLLYAFSGFSVYNVFFNHFHEAMVFFPLLLAAVDAFVLDKKRGVFGFAVFACCTVNYYFFVGQVVFVIIYWILHMTTGSYRMKIKEFLCMAFEAVVGLTLSAIILLPTVLAVIQNPRVENSPSGWNAILYSSEQRYLHIIQSLFFPPDIPARPNFTPDSNAKWASLGAWLPLFSMAGVVGFIRNKRSKWLRKLIPLLLLMAFIPILNSAFQLFNASYYARWFYMLTLMMSLATVAAIESPLTDWKYSIKFTAAVTMGVICAVGFIPKKENVDGFERNVFGLMKYRDRFWIYAAIAMTSLLMLSYVIYVLKNNRKKFRRICMAALSLVIAVYSIYVITIGKIQSYDTHTFVIPYALNNGKDVHLDDLQDVRSDFYDTMDNMGMFWQIPTIQAFHSIVPGSIMDFYPKVGVTRDVGSRPETKYFGLRSFLSVKYLFDYAGTGDDGKFKESDAQTKMPGYMYVDHQNGYDIWKNTYYIPYGFTYEYYMTETQFMDCPEDKRHLLLLKALVVPDEDEGKYDDILNPVDSYDQFDYSNSAYYEDCIARNALCCDYLKYNNDGFDASINLTGYGNKLIFFSVPYEQGWKAYVNGKEVEIQKSCIGFMSVLCEGGEVSDIKFRYTVPGLKPGILITLFAAIIYTAYLLFMYRFGPAEKVYMTKKHKVYNVKLNSDESKNSQTLQRMDGNLNRNVRVMLENTDDNAIDDSVIIVDDLLDEIPQAVEDADTETAENAESEKTAEAEIKVEAETAPTELPSADDSEDTAPVEEPEKTITVDEEKENE